MRRRLSALVVGALVVGACAGESPSEAAGPSPVAPSPTLTSTTVPSTATVPATTLPATTTSTTGPAWEVGAEPLPLRPDGLGEIRPTPEPLRVRELPTRDLLPPPTDGAYHSTVEPLDAATIERMGRTWTDGCPVALGDLRRVELTFWGFDGEHHTGELVVHRDVADDVAWAFGELHAARFPLEQVAIVTPDDLDAPPTGDGNTTAAFVCRPVRGGTTTSAHASGLAIDVNPFTNPYVRGDVVIPERASAYLDRTWDRPGMIHEGDVVTAAFDSIGWSWGGRWDEPDLMHFSATGR